MEFKTYEELRAVVMKSVINRKIENERSSQGDPVDCNHLPFASWVPAWGNPDGWNWTNNQDEKSQSPQSPVDVDCMNHSQRKEKGKSFGKSGPPGGKAGYSQQSPQQWAISMLMRAMGKGGGRPGGHHGGTIKHATREMGFTIRWTRCMLLQLPPSWPHSQKLSQP